MTAEDWTALKMLDIKPEKQAEFITSLSLKYGAQFTDERIFLTQVKAAFQLKQANDAHVLNFGHVHLEQFLEASAPFLARASDVGFFATSGVGDETIGASFKDDRGALEGSPSIKP